MNWWVRQPTRATSERVAIADLQENVNWLNKVAWKLSDYFQMTAEFEITIRDTEIPLKITYPAYFPDVPPQIHPIGELRLSTHQYGAGGELCLEFRPDNWETGMTGAMMIESAHRLLSEEQTENRQNRDIPDAHRTTVAQDVRSKNFRFLLQSVHQQILEAFPDYSVIEVEFGEVYQAQRWIARISRIGGEENPLWSTNLTPLSPSKRIGYAVRLPCQVSDYLPSTFDDLLAFTKEHELKDLTKFIENFSRERSILFVTKGKTVFLSLLKGEDKKDAFIYKTISLQPDAKRQDSEYSTLGKKAVAIIGCGSVGSKIASSLSRAGVGKFVLVDGDLLFPGNIVRNDLDQRSIGLNKPDAVKARIQQINLLADVTVRRVLLGGQESSFSTEAALQNIANCDVIIDATADATIFNLCSAVARNQLKPLVWGEVFSGGVGGIVARARPDIDPPPQVARRQLAAWCADQGVPWDGKESEAYELSRDDAPPMIADDAEVTIIASHLTRLAIDILVREETIFPSSAYAVGLRQEWIFSAPFETYPIDFIDGGKWQQPVTDESNKNLKALIEDLMPGALEATDED